MKTLILILLFFINQTCIGQIIKSINFPLTVSPIIDKELKTNKLLISELTKFLETKNNSLTQNDFWLKTDFEKYIYPYLDIYNIEDSKYGKDFYMPTLMEIISTENENKKILKIGFVGHYVETGENFIKLIYNIMANIESEKITFSRYLDYATKSWTKEKSESIYYIISPNKKVNNEEIIQQEFDIQQLCNFFQTKPIRITFYSCVSPKELFEIKGFDYNPQMYVDSSGGLADFGNIVFSGNNSEIYTHEIIHIYTNNIYPNINKFLDEGIATYFAGSGKYNYEWHRNKLNKFLKANSTFNFANHLDPYERLYFENETSIPYMISALICERTNRIYGNRMLIEILKSESEIWQTLNTVGLTKENINKELRKEIELPIAQLVN